ncbi:MAG: hypothetical protein POG74_12395 [Acidocella sp.]|nr:hypothetical protein [Acidocella sp.]
MQGFLKTLFADKYTLRAVAFCILAALALLHTGAAPFAGLLLPAGLLITAGLLAKK